MIRDWQQPEKLLRQAIELFPEEPEAYYHLGQVCRKTNRPEEAADYFHRAVKLRPDWADAYFALGLVLQKLHRPDGAEVCFRRVVELNPGYAEAHNSLGLILNGADRLDSALDCFSRAVQLKPGYAEAYNNLGVVQARKKLPGEAMRSFRRVIELEPNNPCAHNNLGLSLKELEQHTEAQDSFRRAVELNPGYAEAYHNLGLTLKEAGCFDEAEIYIRRAIELKPDFTLAYNNLVALLAVANRLDEAEESIRMSVRLTPVAPEAHRRLGLVLKMKHRLDEAEAEYRQAIALSAPGMDTEPYFGLGILHLLRGQLLEGWKYYELRRKIFEYPEPPIPYWQGEELAGRSILLFFEQGLGDTLHFIRYVEKVAGLAAQTVIWVQSPLRRLLARSSSCRIHTGAKMPPEKFDFACSLHSLPLLFHTSQQTIPREVPYLWPGNNVAAKWRKALAGADGGRCCRVGVVWAGNPRHDNDRNRSIPFAVFSRLFAAKQVRWVSLQVGERAKDLAGADYQVTDLSRELTDFYETAGVIANLDLVISVDSAVAHLAGAMGKATWLLLPFNPDWRWQLYRGDSPWYPTMRLFRQIRPGDWRHVLEKAASALTNIEEIHQNK
ncbi:MAG: tetratricopeptide repeat protein [Negativicutes bacterium]|nr:tetratricopeptide repeat protein [Negativicutes bacterium]